MALQVWLPLTKDLRNQGLSDVTVTNNGATFNSAGKLGGCYSFSGSSQKIVNTLPSAITSSIGSLSCWIKMNSLPGSSSFYNLLQLGNLGGYATCRLGLYMEYTNYINISIDGSGTSSNRYTHSMVANQWYHICVTYDGTIVKLYIDGSEVLSKTASKGSYTTAASNLYIGGTSSYYLNGYINDARYYNHCLSPMEVKELSKGLVLHYPLSDKFLEGTTNLVTSITSGGQTTWANNILTTSGTNADTYFTLNLSENIVNGTQYTISCDAEDIPQGTCWTFPLGQQGNTALSFQIYNGHNEYTFTANNISWGTKRCFMDDGGSPNSARATGAKCKIYNFQIEKKDHATGFAGYGGTRNVNTVYDCSGFVNNGTASNIIISTDTPKYKYSSTFNGTNSYIKVNDNNWMIKGMSEITVNLWAKATTWPTNGGRLLSCTESGGFNLEGGNSGYWRFPIYVYTNSGQTSSAYKYDSNEIKIADLIPDEWNMITLVYDNTGTKTYLNGVLHHTYTNTSYGINFNTNARLFLGCEANTASPYAPYFNGKESDFRIYATALSASDVKSLYQNCATIDPDGTIRGKIR